MKSIQHLIDDMKLEDELIRLRREFHKYPELSGQETETMERICRVLDEWEIPYKKNVAETGVVAIIEGKGQGGGNTVGLRGDTDALPIVEGNSGTEYCSKNNGVMHACGHDAHIAILLGAAKIFKSIQEELCGNVKLFFQPAEETTGGAERMIQAGCLENPRVDYVLGLHVEPRFYSGQVGIRYGKLYAASDHLNLTITGKSAHGAHPEEGEDAIVAAAAILMAVQTVFSRNMGTLNPAVCSFGKIKGGTIRNQIADKVELEGILRTLDVDIRKKAKARLKKVCEQTAEAMGVQAELDIIESYGPLINNDEVTDVVLKNARTVLGENCVFMENEPNLATEDFSYFAQERKSSYFHLGCRRRGEEGFVDLHNSGFDIDESCLLIGVRLQVENVLSLMKKKI